jgi:hypothetical protein
MRPMSPKNSIMGISTNPKPGLLNNRNLSDLDEISQFSIKRYYGYLRGYIYIRVTTKKFFKKWSRRYFTLRDGILRLWKNKEDSGVNKANQEINFIDINRVNREKERKTNSEKFFFTDINLYPKEMNISFFVVKDRINDILKDIITIGSCNPQGLKLLRDEFTLLTKF